MNKVFTVIAGSALVLPVIASANWDSTGGYGTYGMMGYGAGMGGFGFFMVFGGIVWTVVGVLAAVWLWQQVNKK